MRRVAIAFVLVGSQACVEGDTPDGTTTMLIDPDGWEMALEADDPFASQRPDEAMCDPLAITQELFGSEPALEISTDLCNWVSLTQPLRTTVPKGAMVTLRLWHFDLTAPVPAEARLALAIDGEPVWEKQIPIPSTSGLVRETWAIPATVPADAPIVFHLDNHGANMYALLEISAVW